MEYSENSENQETPNPTQNIIEANPNPNPKEQAKAKHRQIHPDSYHHGLASHGVVIPGEDAAAVLERMNFWRKDFRPDSPAQE